jgi:peptidoglycan-N-acetylglucosamine deacetylase
VKIVRDQPHARWLPSRFRFAAFRLLAWAIFRSKQQPAAQPDGTLILGIDRDQSALENYTMAVWMSVVTTSFAFVFLDRVLSRGFAIVLAPIVAQVVLQLFVVWQLFGPASWRNRNNIDVNSFIGMMIVTIVAIYFVGSDHWVRYVAWAFLASLAVNAVAAMFTGGMRRVILAGVCVAPVIAAVLWTRSPLAALGIVMVSHALVLYPTLRANSQWLGPVNTTFAAQNKEVWLTIDDGPTSDTVALLDALDSRQAKATFFVKGTLASQNPDLVRAIVARGHAVANHSYSHPSASFWALPPERIRREIEMCNDVIREITGSAPALFRAPVGMKNPFVHPALGSMKLIGWTARAFDTTTDDPEAVLRRLRPDVRPGAILLLHQGRPRSVEIIAHVVDALQADGYTFVLPSALSASLR